MAKKIEVKICTGTTCYVMGASDLLTLEDYLEPSERERVEISGLTCLGKCKDNEDEKEKPPFVLVDGQLVSGADINTLIDMIKGKLEGE